MMKLKKVLVITMFLGCLFGQGQTNVYHPFPTDTAYWGRATSSPSCNTSPCPYERVIQAGDTLINSMIYKKVYNQWGTFGPPSNCGGMGTSCYTPTSALGYWCALRQDSAAKKVYTVPPGASQDTLLYDFNLHLGDTLPESFATSGGTWVVQKIDSVLIGGHYNKAFIFDTTGAPCSYLIEGVGSTHGLIGFSDCLGSCEWVDCFNHDAVPGTVGSGGSGFFCGNYAIAGIKNESQAQMQIFPNPTSGMIEVSLLPDASCIQVLDVVGTEIQKQVASGEKVEIDISAFENGIYFVQIKTPEGYITRKIVKQ